MECPGLRGRIRIHIMFLGGSLDPLPLTLRSRLLFARGREEMDWEEVENCLLFEGEGGWWG